ncbi:phage tail protein [Pseudomonas viridiflava]|uniref:phage tail protein n=1 Tax=Pseudomonas viridiflava TaxID=33069 RepID=UPI002EC0625F|nr:phage tail protein [Pseudomonas viridiflava]MEE3972383.1 phage tail protein [Pseudomonas viridiflava]MEE4017224.1 phage tail protein [Pseudomonas viridiflava]MEE4046190.1 phage tail protein [Pseudomonas viridiflava]
MIDQNTQFFATLTNVGAAKQANADALGVPWKIAQMGVGDANGADPIPSATQKQLINERRRAPLNQLKVDPANNAIVIAEQVIPAEVGGFWIREIGLYDADGDLVAVANCAPSFKPLLAQGSGRTQVVRINLLVSNTSNVELRIDPSVVLATRALVEQRIQEELAKLDNKQSVRVATTGPINLVGLQSVDGVATAANDRVLVKNQASGRDNGIYSVVAGGAWVRVIDADASVEVTPNLMVSVEQGDTLFDTLWQLTTNAPIILGTTALVFEQVAGPTGVLPGTYNRVTVDRRGLVMAGFNPTTLGGYGIADAYSKAEIDARVAALQPKLAFTPVQQGTGTGQLNNLIKLGWSGSAIKATVDNSDMGNLWYSGNFDPATKANVGTTLFSYGITDAYSKAEVYTKAETDARDAQRPLADSITNIGFAANDPTQPYMRRASDNTTYFLQTRIPYVPVQQGTGPGQSANLIKLGWSPGGLKAAVDNTDLGTLWYSGNFNPNTKANVGSTLFAYGITDAYTKAETDARDMERPLKSEVYAKADVYTKTETDSRVNARPIADSITHVGFAADNSAAPYLRRTADAAVYFLVSDQNLGQKIANLGLTGIGQYAFARVITAYGNSINQGTSVPGANLIFSSTAVGDGTSSNSGAIGIGVWRAQGAFNNTERTLFQRIQ